MAKIIRKNGLGKKVIDFFGISRENQIFQGNLLLYRIFSLFLHRQHFFLLVMPYTYKYPRPAVTADCVIITRETEPSVLLIERGSDPFKGCWAFPGGFLEMEETTAECAIRELQEETGIELEVTALHQIGAYSKVDRDPRGRTITVAYLAIIDEPVAALGQDDAAEAKWWPLNHLPELAFDHDEIMADAKALYELTIHNS